MAEIITMPKLSDTMTDGVVAEWHKKVGDPVESGEVLAEIETDKATMDFESYSDGVLLHIGVEKGGTAPVDALLAIIGEKGEDITELIKEGAEPPPAAPETPKDDASAPAPAEKNPAEKAPAEKAPAPKSNQAAPAPAPAADGSRLKASPLAKKMATDLGYNLNIIPGSGEAGRIVKRDVEHFVPGSGSNFSAAVAGVESFRDEPVSQMRKVIARRLAESKFGAPHFYLTLEIDMDNAMAARKVVNASGDVKISFNDFVVKAVSKALKLHPVINASWLEDTIRYNDHVHIGIAVAVEDGLLVPVVRHADTKGMAQISAEVKDFAQKAKDKKLQPADWEGNTFTISNLGMFGIEEFTAIINPPDSCILAVGGIKQVPVVKNGHVVPGNIMKLTLSCDHRVVDGASGAAFLQTVKSNLENPVMMLV